MVQVICTTGASLLRTQQWSWKELWALEQLQAAWVMPMILHRLVVVVRYPPARETWDSQGGLTANDNKIFDAHVLSEKNHIVLT